MEDINTNSPVKIGELLINMGALTTGDLTEAIQISRRMGVPIGRVLVMSGCVTEECLQQALELQSMVRDGLIDLETGLKGLEKVFKEGIELQVALRQLNWAPRQHTASNKLGELLIDSNVVTKAQVERALEASFQSGMPLGGTLVLQGVLSAQLLPTILHVQEQIRDSKLPRNDAVEQLKQAVMFWARADKSKTGEFERGNLDKTVQGHWMPPVPDEATRTMSLVDLLKLSGYCTQNTLDHAIKQAMSDSRLASRMLLAINFIDAASLNQYVQMQAMMAKGELVTEQALKVLAAMQTRQIPLEQALLEIGITTTP